MALVLLVLPPMPVAAAPVVPPAVPVLLVAPPAPVTLLLVVDDPVLIVVPLPVPVDELVALVLPVVELPPVVFELEVLLEVLLVLVEFTVLLAGPVAVMAVTLCVLLGPVAVMLLGPTAVESSVSGDVSTTVAQPGELITAGTSSSRPDRAKVELFLSFERWAIGFKGTLVEGTRNKRVRLALAQTTGERDTKT